MIYHDLIPPAVLLSSGRPPSVVPDATIDVALPAVSTRRDRRRDDAAALRRHPGDTGRQRGPSEALRRHSFDVKTIHCGHALYRSARARCEQSGAVREREHQVHPGYRAHARKLDTRFTPGVVPGPIEQRMESYGTTRGLVFGGYSEASPDVHDLITIAAARIADARWEFAGARSAAEMRSYITATSRQRVGLAVAQAFALHRLARVPFIGVPRQYVASRARRPQPGAVQYAPDPAHFDFYRWQGSMQGWAAGAAVGWA
jgi:hypothetical protein